MKLFFQVLTTLFIVLSTLFVLEPPAQSQNATFRGVPMRAMDPATRELIERRQAREDEAQVLKEQAKDAIKKGDYSDGLSLLQQAVSNDRTEGEACVLLAYLYLKKDQPGAVIATLDPIVNPPANVSISVGKDITVRMIYILALLDSNAWRDAVACYERTWRPVPLRFFPGYIPSHKWSLPGGGPSHAWPDAQFSPDVPDFAGLRAQAHLILGSRSPMYMEDKIQYSYMLEHVRQVLQINPKSLDASFISGWLLGKLDHFAEARAAYARAGQLASPSVQPEINEEVRKLNTREQAQKAYEAQHAGSQAKQ